MPDLEPPLQTSLMNDMSCGWLGLFPQWRIDPESGDIEIVLPEGYHSNLVWLDRNDLRAMLADLEASRA